MHTPAQDVKDEDGEVERALRFLANQLSSGATLEGLGGDIGVDHSTVSRWHNRNRTPTGKNKLLFLQWFRRNLGHPSLAGGDYWAGVRAAVTRVESALEQLRQEMDAASAQQNVTPANNKADPEGRPITSLDDTQEILKLQGKPATPPPTEKQEKQGGA